MEIAAPGNNIITDWVSFSFSSALTHFNSICCWCLNHLYSVFTVTSMQCISVNSSRSPFIYSLCSLPFSSGTWQMVEGFMPGEHCHINCYIELFSWALGEDKQHSHQWWHWAGGMCNQWHLQCNSVELWLLGSKMVECAAWMVCRQTSIQLPWRKFRVL